MISIVDIGNVHDYRGLSSDMKPTEKVGNGSTFLEIDTGDLYCFDGDSKSWIKLSA